MPAVSTATLLSVAQDLVAGSPVAERFNPNNELVILPKEGQDAPFENDDPFAESLQDDPDFIRRKLDRISLPGHRKLTDEFPYPIRFIGRIGQSGWDYVNGVVDYIPLDIDLKGDHEKGLSASQIEQLVFPSYCEVRRSTGGGGLHIIIRPTHPIKAETRQQFTAAIDSAIARLAVDMPGIEDSVDRTAAGRGVLWLWPVLNHRSFELLASATQTLDLPQSQVKERASGAGLNLPLILGNLHYTPKPYPPADDGKGYLVPCPFHKHEGGDTKTMVWVQQGVPCFNCFADKCKHRTWKDFAKKNCPEMVLTAGATAVLRAIYFALSRDEFFHDKENESFTTVGNDTYSVDSQRYKDILRLRYREATGQSIGSAQLAQAIEELRAHTTHHCPLYSVYRRVGKHEGKYYLDLCNDEREIVEMDSDGWRVRSAAEVPIRFLRPTKFLPIPKPVEHGTIEALWKFVTVEPEDRPAILAWLLGSLRVDIACALLLLVGEAGCAKTSNGSFVAAIVNPVSSEDGKSFAMVTTPRNEQELAIIAKNNYILGIDNLSQLSKQMSDALCCIITGASDESRKLYTNSDESRFTIRRPVLMTSIKHVVSESDLADRTLAVNLPSMGKGQRKTEAQLWTDFDSSRPDILGALLSAFVFGLRNQGESALPEFRLQDFAEFAQDAETYFGFNKGATVAAMNRMQRTASESAVDESPLAKAIIEHVTTDFKGSAKVLRELIGPGDWPDTARSFANAFKTIIPDLQKIGMRITSRMLDGRTTYEISPAASAPSSTDSGGAEQPL